MSSMSGHRQAMLCPRSAALRKSRIVIRFAGMVILWRLVPSVFHMVQAMRIYDLRHPDDCQQASIERPHLRPLSFVFSGRLRGGKKVAWPRIAMHLEPHRASRRCARGAWSYTYIPECSRLYLW
ncbi:hypothetical protein GY45DRAFT_1316465 [Cubamyces sp. BRFM 1775]|nr:hypothetical protein GY45DRAFT_1316465 [Cubamyces sp. BRFM 1775]